MGCEGKRTTVVLHGHLLHEARTHDIIAGVHFSVARMLARVDDLKMKEKV